VIDELTRRQILIQRFAGGQIERTLPILRKLATDLRNRLAAGNLTDFQAGRLSRLNADIGEIIAQSTAKMQGVLQLDDFADQEAAFAAKVLGGAVSVELNAVSPERLRAVATQSRMVLGGNKRLTIPQAFDELGGAVGRDAYRTLQAGIVEGKTQQQMTREVYELVRTRTRRQVETVVRTATNHVGAAARNEVFRANSDILEGERYVATLDGRTTITCASLDGKVFALGEGRQPPLHYGCRSIRVPVIKAQYRRGRVGERASMDGPVDGRVTYGGFLKRQSKEFQDEALGPERAALFRSGKVSITKFTDDRGRILTLDELASKEGLSF